MIPSTAQRVPEYTADHVNQQIREQTRRNVERVAAQGPAAIDRRLRELDAEWDIERTLEANAATITAVGSGLALLVDRRFALVPLVVGSFLLQHAVQGWCPPLPVFRRMGVRTQTVLVGRCAMSGDDWVLLLVAAGFLALWLFVLPRTGLG